MAWLALVGLLGIEVFGALTRVAWLAWGAAPAMVALVAFAFMHAGRASALSRVFAIAGLFWVAILLTLGTVDFAVRRDAPAPRGALVGNVTQPVPM